MKERDSFEAICSEKVRVNRSFLKMGILYGPREAPRERKRGANTSAPFARLSEGPTAKKAKKAEPVVSQSMRAPKVVAERPSGTSRIRPAAARRKIHGGKISFLAVTLFILLGRIWVAMLLCGSFALRRVAFPGARALVKGFTFILINLVRSVQSQIL